MSLVKMWCDDCQEFLIVEEDDAEYELEEECCGACGSELVFEEALPDDTEYVSGDRTKE